MMANERDGMSLQVDIESMNLLEDRIDMSSLDGEMADAAEELNRSLDRIAAIVDEYKNQQKKESS